MTTPQDIEQSFPDHNLLARLQTRTEAGGILCAKYVGGYALLTQIWREIKQWDAEQAARSAPAAPVEQEGKTAACACGDEFPADSYGAGFLDAKGKCFGCDAADCADEGAPVELPGPDLRVTIGLYTDGIGYVRDNLVLKMHDCYTADTVRQLLETAHAR